MKTIFATTFIAFACFGQPARMLVNTPLPAASSGGSTALLTTGGGGSVQNNYSGAVGLNFTAANNAHVTSLGRWIVAGNNQSHILVLATTSGSVIACCTVNASGAASGAYLYGSVGTPVAITAGTTYILLSVESSGGDNFCSAITVSFTGEASALSLAYANVGTSCSTVMGPNLNNGANTAYGPVNLQYTTP